MSVLGYLIIAFSISNQGFESSMNAKTLVVSVGSLRFVRESNLDFSSVIQCARNSYYIVSDVGSFHWELLI